MVERRNVLKQFEENRELIEERTNKEIEKYRKGNARIVFKDSNGNCLNNAEIELKQISHEFKYGANIFMLDEFETEEKNKKYREVYKDTFNMATLPFYWKDLEPVEGEPRFGVDSPKVYRRPAIDLCMQYCRENGIEPKEHCLVYELWAPDWLDKTDVELMKKKYEERIRILAEKYGSDIPRWEVINEMTFFYKDSSALYKEPDLIEWSFKIAEKYLGDKIIYINDAHCNIWNVFNWNRSQYYMQIERAIANGARIDEIGLQFHMFYPKESELEDTKIFYDPIHMYNVLDQYAKFGKPMQITEITIPAYSDSDEDEQIQAEIIRWLYTIWFGYGQINQIVYWNLVDGYAAFAPQGDMSAGENCYAGGLFRFDMTPKPAYYMIKHLFEEVWHTECKTETDENGMIDFRGFYGEYKVTIKHGDEKIEKCFSLTKNTDEIIEITL